ncbi:MAG: alpha/beta hydrolase [Firmicutes bacterium]|nr:alpha/beta hydrolase [Bacillota bacterium]
MSLINKIHFRYYLGVAIHQASCKVASYAGGLTERIFFSSQGNIRYFSNQKNSKPTLVFLHGFNGNKEVWLGTAFYLRNAGGILIPDLLGHGASDNPMNGDYSAEAHASVIYELLKAEEISSFYLVGSSMGCAVAAILMIRYGSKNIGSIFINPFGITSEQIRSIRHFRKGTASPFYVKDIDDYDDFLKSVVYRPLLILSWSKHYFALNHIRRNEHIGIMFDALLANVEFYQILRNSLCLWWFSQAQETQS